MTLPDPNRPEGAALRPRHPAAARIRNVTANGESWQRLDATRETVPLGGLRGTVRVEARY